MGVPRFFRWLTDRYPEIVQRVSPKRLPEFDNLYLDMNGIIHQCTHPSDRDPFVVLPEDEMFQGIFDTVDKLFAIANPRKLLFVAVDGVAPRAKMNQQRQRRFRAAREAAEALALEAKRRGPLTKLPKPFDSNCITPGTKFMATLSTAIRSYLLKRVREDDRWRNVTVIYSGHEVPGEGEHKIMEYLRRRKQQADYDPFETHCLYGLDADLIMLGLVTHERNFSLLREDVTWRGGRNRRRPKNAWVPFQLLFMNRIRAYLDQEFCMRLPFGYSLSRVVDDFVFLCYFMGNDFLPHLPAADIPTGGLDAVLRIYGELLPTLGGYLTSDGTINLPRFEKFCVRLAVLEKEEFVRRAIDKWRKGGAGICAYTPIHYAERRRGDVPEPLPPGTVATPTISAPTSLPGAPRIPRSASSPNLQRAPMSTVASSEASPAASAEASTATAAAVPPFAPKGGAGPAPQATRGRRRSWSAGGTANNTTRETPPGVEGIIDEDRVWQQRYYGDKLGFGTARGVSAKQQKEALVRCYVEGLVWMLHYYYKGIASWKWFFPFHYAPLAADLTNVSRYDFHFELDEPFLPFQQLLGVLPAASEAELPPPYRPLMTSPSSPIADFYSTTFEIDMVGKRNSWEGLALIPFMDEERLIAACKSIGDDKLTQDELERNSFDREYVFQYGLEGEWNYFP